MKVKFNIEAISEVSKKILDNIVKKDDNNKAKVIALSGDLGAGKTTLTKEIGKLLGIKNNIISPTFVIMKIYEIDKDSEYYTNFKKLIHIDAYRLDRASELLKIGWKEISCDKDNLIIIEWPERVEECLDRDVCLVKLEHIDEETRTFEF
jgi:tRNA threonylcarbamoyladenosine biosynthesis protein TsaE